MCNIWRSIMRPKWRGVVIHCTEGKDTEALETDGLTAYHLSLGWSDLGYQWVIENNEGSPWVVAGRPMNRTGAHCLGYNHQYFGFAFHCAVDVVPDRPTLQKAAQFIAGMLDTLELPRTAVFAHSELNDTSCPDAVPMGELKQMILDV